MYSVNFKDFILKFLCFFLFFLSNEADKLHNETLSIQIQIQKSSVDRDMSGFYISSIIQLKQVKL